MGMDGSPIRQVLPVDEGVKESKGTSGILAFNVAEY